MCSVRRITSAETIVCSLAVAGLLLLSSCKQPESQKEQPVSQQSAPPPPVTAQYKEGDCTCDDTKEKKVNLDDFLAGAIKAKKNGTLDQFIAEHMATPPTCIRIKDNENDKQHIRWQADKNKPNKFQIIKFVNAQDGMPAELFDTSPPFPSNPGYDADSGKTKTSAPANPTPGKCYVFKAYVKVISPEFPSGFEVDPHVGTNK